MEIVEKVIEPMLIAGIRICGHYRESGRLFSTLGSKFGRHISGRAFNLYYDEEYKEGDAGFKSCFPIKRAVDIEGISVRELTGRRCLSCLHHGPTRLCQSLTA